MVKVNAVFITYERMTDHAMAFYFSKNLGSISFRRSLSDPKKWQN